MNVAVRIQHHPSRADLIPPLLERLDGFQDVQVVTDPGGMKSASWRSHRACLQAVPDDASHLLVLQDDAVPCQEFAAKARAVIAEHPHRVIAFFVPGFGNMIRRLTMAQKRGLHTVDIPITSYAPLVAACYPAEIAREIPGFIDGRRMNHRSDDAAVALYISKHRLGMVATVPCLVQHDDTVPSAMGRRHIVGQRHRVAVCFADA